VNGTTIGTYVSADSFSIPVDTTGSGTYTGGGQVDGGDLGAIDGLLQSNVTPDNTTCLTVSARALPISISASVSVPQAYVAAYTIAVQVQLAAQIASYPIGGNAQSSPAYSVPWDDILGALDEAGVLALGQASYVRSVGSLVLTCGSQTANQSGQGILFAAAYPGKALLGSVSVQVLGV
jgi:hypothetical protein